MFKRVLIALGLLLIGVPAAFVSAHAEYERSTPARDEVVAEAPARVDVFFTQDVFKQAGKNYVRVFDDGETQVSDGDGAVDDDNRRHIFADLPAGLANGRYIVEWGTTSDEDGESDDGAFCFYVSVEPTADQQAACAALAEDEEVASPTPAAAATNTPAAAAATPTELPPVDSVDLSDDGVPTVALVIGAIAGAALVVVVGGTVAVWLRRATG